MRSLTLAVLALVFATLSPHTGGKDLYQLCAILCAICAVIGLIVSGLLAFNAWSAKDDAKRKAEQRPQGFLSYLLVGPRSEAPQSNKDTP